MSEDTNIIDGEGLFGFVPATPLSFDPHAEARRQERARREAAEKEEMARRIAELPTREELAVRAIDIATSHIMPDTKLKAMQFYAQLMGFMDKDGKKRKGEDETASGPKIMAVPVSASPDEWEKIASAYSKRLEKIANG